MFGQITATHHDNALRRQVLDGKVTMALTSADETFDDMQGLLAGGS